MTHNSNDVIASTAA